MQITADYTCVKNVIVLIGVTVYLTTSFVDDVPPKIESDQKHIC